MHKIGKLGLQVFAAPDNMTGTDPGKSPRD